MSPSVNMGPTAWKISDITWDSTESGVFEIERVSLSEILRSSLCAKDLDDSRRKSRNLNLSFWTQKFSKI